MDNVKLECTYRDLYHMILLPKALTYRPSLNSDPAANTPGTPAGGGKSITVNYRGGGGAWRPLMSESEGDYATTRV